jgi:hypothetical protein
LVVSVAAFASMLAVHKFFPQHGAHLVAGYVIVTGVISLTIAWGSRQPGILGSMAWLLVGGWAVHVAVIIGLSYFGVWDVRELAHEPKPYASLWNSVGTFTVLLLGGDWLLSWLRERVRRGRSAGRRGPGPSAAPS